MSRSIFLHFLLFSPTDHLTTFSALVTALKLLTGHTYKIYILFASSGKTKVQVFLKG